MKSDDSFSAGSDDDGDEYLEGSRSSRRSSARRGRNSAARLAHGEGMLLSAQDDAAVPRPNELSLAVESVGSASTPAILSRDRRNSLHDEMEESSVSGSGRRGGGSGRKRTRSVPPTPTEKRTENSLGSLTQRFVALVKHAEAGMLDLNTAAESLSVRKRRVYDITNVLEGIGLIEKTTKNVVQWKGSGFATDEDRAQFEALQATIAEQTRREEAVDARVSRAKNELRILGEDSLKSSLAYVTYSDVTSLPQYKEQAVLAIKSPPNTILKVPDPDDGMPHGQRRYQIHLKNPNGNAIYAFLLTNEDLSADPNNPTGMLSGNKADEEGEGEGAGQERKGEEDDADGLARKLFNHAQHAGLLSVQDDDELGPDNSFYGLPTLTSFEGVMDCFLDE